MFKMNLQTLIGFVIGLVVVAACEFIFEGGSLLYSMLFFVTLAQGPITILAATEIVQSDWAKPYKKYLLSVRHMNFFLALLFVVFILAGKLNLYDWAHHPNAWLNSDFFAIRNVVLLLLAWVVANKYAKESLNESKTKTMWSLFWIFTFVLCQTIVAFDWIMSLEYPWISTLFGIYTFVEAFYAGLGLAAFFTYFKYMQMTESFGETRVQKSQMDMMTLMFGFSIFWAYQFFSQYIVIWYGNIPEEVAFLSSRLETFGNTLYLVPFILFFIPFWSLLSRKVKGNPRAVMVIAAVIWAGLLLERFFYLRPHMTLNPLITVVEFLAIGVVFLVVMRNGVSGETAQA